VERGEEIVGGRGRGDRLLRREGRLAERRVVVARGVLDAPALAYLLKRLVGKSRRRVNERDVVVVERVERGRDDADRLDVRLKLDALAPVKLAARDDRQLDVRRDGEVRERDRVGEVLAHVVG